MIGHHLIFFLNSGRNVMCSLKALVLDVPNSKVLRAGCSESGPQDFVALQVIPVFQSQTVNKML